MRDSIRVKGMVMVRVLDSEGNVKRKEPGWLRRLFHCKGRPLEHRHHNVVTRQGDALIADALLASPARTKVSSTSGFIQVGTGWSGNSAKNTNRCNTPIGSMNQLDAGCPVLKAVWGNTGDTTITYKATFAAGALNASGINEAALLNGSNTGADCLAYAQITPSVNVTTSDTLQIVWEITFLGQ